MDYHKIEMYTAFYLEKDQAAICGVAFKHGAKMKLQLMPCPNGDYLNGLLALLTNALQPLKSREDDWRLHLNVHVHHKNTNFLKVLTKVNRAADTARNYEPAFRENIIKGVLTRKDYKRPNCYEKMAELARLMVDLNEPDYRVTLSTCGDSKGRDQVAVYTACLGAWNDLKSATDAVAVNTAEPVAETSELG